MSGTLRLRDRLARVGLVFVVVKTLAWSVVACAGMGTDLNPDDVRQETVVGKWKSSGILAPAISVTYRADGRFELSHDQRITGEWFLQDWNLTLQPAGGGVEYWRVIKDNGEHRLLRHYCGSDDDCGERQIAFRRE